VRVDFYHLKLSPLERVLPTICERVVAQGERMLVVAERDLLDRLDGQLWTYAPESFLPHGRAGGERDDRQPVLLSEGVEPANGARNIALADGRWREKALAFERVFHFFGAAELDAARDAWRSLKGSDAERHYWQQDESGRWTEAG
jgi:DNA polymerase III subunit chi